MERPKTKQTLERKKSQSQACEQVAARKGYNQRIWARAIVSHRSESGWNGLQLVSWYEMTKGGLLNCMFIEDAF